MSDEEATGDEPIPEDDVPSPSKWRKRLGLAGLASLGGAVAWLFGRRDKPDS